MSNLYKITTFICIAFAFVLDANIASAQNSAEDYRDEFLGQFEYSSGRLVALAEAMPEDTYTWSPDGEAMPVAQVYMHIARYNFLYPEWALGIASPDDIDLDTMEEITDKEEVLDLLQRSVNHVRESISGLSKEKLEASTELYGRTVSGWAVLYQLQTHMSEHVGQSIAYARMNKVTPPWSE